MKTHAPDMRATFEQFVLDQREILTCFSMSGEWDYLLRIVAADVSAYEHFLMRKLLTHEAVLMASSHFALGTVKNDTALMMPEL
ncbi:MAG: Lrp/AsnC ligand binding domain-containing protein [Sphingorhabdus sp.]